MDAAAQAPRAGRGAVFGITAAALGLYLALSGLRLTAQGLYSDEIAQAAPAFAYVGQQPLATEMSIRGVPVLNKTYVGAVKSGVYGLYLRLSGRGFGVASWRWLGIGFAALGLALFCGVAGPRLGAGGLLLFVALLLTDRTLVLSVRHDWGPVALALLLRLGLLAIGVRAALGAGLSTAGACAMGALAGFAVFEKLSSVVLLLPAVLLLGLGMRERQGGARAGGWLRTWAAFAVGGVAGGLPLLAVNLVSWRRSGQLVSLAETHASGAQPLVDFVPLHYFGLASSPILEHWLLGFDELGAVLRSVLLASLETVLMLGLLACTALAALQAWRQDRALRLAGVLLLSYLGTAALLMLLPRSTWIHHWILGTPFQYAALAAALPVLAAPPGSSGVRAPPWWLARPFQLGLGLLLLLRLVCVGLLAGALVRGQASIHWDPSLTRFGAFAAARADEAIVVTADWGITPQVYCLAGGRVDVVYEPFHTYSGPGELQRLIEQSGRTTVYLAYKVPRANMAPQNTARILQDMGRLPGCREVPVEPEARELAAVRVRKFLCAPAALGGGGGA